MSSLIVSGLIVPGCLSCSSSEIEQRISTIAAPSEFSIVKWEFSSVLEELRECFTLPTRVTTDDIETVKTYFALTGEDEAGKADLENRVELVLAKQIKQVLAEERIVNPLDNYMFFKFIFPPINFEFAPPPHLLVISPRDRIELLRRTILKPDISTEEKEAIESEIDALGVSSLVVRLGGVGFTYPPMVVETADLRFAINTAVEEWFHQYMIFQPLGFLYALDAIGVRPDYDVITMNETLAGIISKEIGHKVYLKYYGSDEETIPEEKPESEFGSLMREIRIRVDAYLAEGKITEAEEFMQESRDFLETKGYHIRKLNQAYFAFHGTYADAPTSVSAIGEDLMVLRERCSSLREFLDEVIGMTSYEDLKKVVVEREK